MHNDGHFEPLQMGGTCTPIPAFWSRHYDAETLRQRCGNTLQHHPVDAATKCFHVLNA